MSVKYFFKDRKIEDSLDLLAIEGGGLGDTFAEVAQVNAVMSGASTLPIRMPTKRTKTTLGEGSV